MQIYLARNNQQAGPYNLEQVNQMLASQQVLLTDLAWHEGMAEWKTLGELTQGKLVYEPVGYSPFSSQIKTETNEPTYTIKVERKASDLASIPSRFFAKVIDIFLWLPATFILTSFFTPEQAQKFTQLNEQLFQLMADRSSDIALAQKVQEEILTVVPSHAWMAMCAYIIIMLMIQAFLIGKSGQSIGKKLTKIKIVDAETSEPVSTVRGFWLRSIVFIILNIITVPLISVLESLFAFGKKRQTLHDKLAKTKVIKQ
ncbi:RDD family protein [Acinetobacter sp. Tr-809]|uniref:RDD family protein n=1 Tax=Acinetobacter sp. Tr-809 TaxID=2608324 RepID=UPI001421A1C6|nr:RDD family protein [Acinetobacter sp. Tr-809]NIE96260.1 RDD family protein [Acinetobacter sp. Tr-809]